MKPYILLFALVTFPLSAEENPQQGLAKIEAQLTSTPNKPMLHYKKCQALFAKGEEQKAIDHAAITLTKFKQAKVDLAWMLLGSITTKEYKIDIHYNMGKSERSDNKDGIVRPYSFRVWTKGENPQLVRILDFELAYFEGDLVSAAIGEAAKGRHVNLGIVPSDSKFVAIKKKIIKILQR